MASSVKNGNAKQYGHDESWNPNDPNKGRVYARLIQDGLSPLDGVFPFDEAVIEALPKDVTYTSVERFRTRAWTVTGKVTTKKADGTTRLFFLKVAYGDHGRLMLRGEHESSKMIHSIIPGFIPTPYGYGRYKVQSPDTYFYLSQFIDMNVTTAPDPEDLMGRLAELHKNSQSPTGKFGFLVTTYDGNVPHLVKWESKWVDFFRNLFLHACTLDSDANEPWPELELAIRQMSEVVIPRLLGKLRQSGSDEPVKPCLIHGDLWEGNRGISLETGNSVVYDASSYFAHNEMEFGNWRSELNTFFRSKTYMDHYHKHFPPAEPAEEFGDRNRLYSIKVAINYSAMCPGSIRRKTAYNNMCYLVQKYAPIEGVDQYDPDSDPFVTGAYFQAYSNSD
ncbi:Fructosamine kinase-domain-containing protein [Stachybotrys elegans]|uniref:protein-ribulosamine 3-kinase n=1 Tax=Stachybotrys elegans TaxID=80388 RepID=A0A8K0SV70_9HYPO|nr:Fructosamine kinase-domain-containing protein [Stachybotrys elegans]